VPSVFDPLAGTRPRFYPLPACTASEIQAQHSRVINTFSSMAPAKNEKLTLENLEKLLEHDNKVKVGGVDIDGIIRGKLITKKKFLSIAKDGFGFCSVIFGWDMHDQTYVRELKISNAENGYHDIVAVPDLSSFRRIPWENDIPFFLVSFYDPDSHESLSACPRSLLARAVDKIAKAGYGAMAGA